MADDALSVQQVKDSLDAYVRKMNLLTGDMSSAPERVKEFLERHNSSDLLTAFYTLEDLFNQSENLLEVARDEVRLAANELKAATLKFDQLDYTGKEFANKIETQKKLEEISDQLDKALQDRNSLRTMIQMAANQVVNRATKEELQQEAARVNEIGKRMDSLEFTERTHNTNQELVLQQHANRLQSVESDIKRKANNKDVYTRGETDEKFAYRKELPTLETLGGISKEMAAQTYGDRKDVEDLKGVVYHMSDINDESLLLKELKRLKNDKADRMQVYSREISDQKFALKADVPGEDAIRTMAADEVIKRLSDSKGDYLFITTTQAESFIRHVVAVEVDKQLKGAHVIPEDFPLQEEPPANS